MIKEFGKDYGEFLGWFKSNPDSFLINTGKTAKSTFAMLHTTNCPHLKPTHKDIDLPEGKNSFKVCSKDIMSLYEWCQQHRPLISMGFSDLCKDCFPEPNQIWGQLTTRNAIDLDVDETSVVTRKLGIAYRIVRDTHVSRYVKRLHDNCCQLCGCTLELSDGGNYSEAHHIQPLSKGGPDIKENIICVCPNHHALLDFTAILLELTTLRLHPEHDIDPRYIAYQNEQYNNITTKRRD